VKQGYKETYPTTCLSETRSNFAGCAVRESIDFARQVFLKEPITLTKLLSSFTELNDWKQHSHHSGGVRGGVRESVLVPTLGNLHEGHASLIRHAKAVYPTCPVVVSLFVNPTQFGPSEDFTQYPRTLESDLKLCEAEGVTAVYHPSIQDLYPLGVTEAFQVIPPSSLTQGLCGQNRPGHFNGVAQVVLRLFQQVEPKAAIFGEKDAQQLAILTQLVADMRLPLEIVPSPTVREAGGGLALSSRNHYLTPISGARESALQLSRFLEGVETRFHQATASGEKLRARETFQEVLQALPPVPLPIEWLYTEAVSWQWPHPSLAPSESLESGVRVCVAAKVAGVRLIDNGLLL
jgi:pantoate ligase / CMP/dCMP kinase